MDFDVIYYDANGETAREQWRGNLDKAKLLVEAAVASGSATKAEIRSEKGIFLFGRPRVIRKPANA